MRFFAKKPEQPTINISTSSFIAAIAVAVTANIGHFFSVCALFFLGLVAP